MTGITRPLARLTCAAIHSAGKRRPVVIELDPNRPGLVGFRLKGTRTSYYLPVEWCFKEAMRAELARQRAERRKLRKGKSNGTA